MPYYALIYQAGENFMERRMPFREEHLRLAKEASHRSELVLAGALTEPPDRALLVFYGPDAASAKAFAENDPYVKNGLIKQWEIRPWVVMVGGDAPQPGPAPSQARVARLWSARANSQKADQYLAYFSRSVLPHLRGIPGFVDARVLTQSAGPEVEILVETFWNSWEAISQFAGADRDAAVVSEEAAKLLISHDSRVRHYEVAATAFPAVPVGTSAR